MKGFWETWIHIFAGLSVAAVICLVVFCIYDTGRIHGRVGEHKVGYENGYKFGYNDGISHRVREVK